MKNRLIYVVSFLIFMFGFMMVANATSQIVREGDSNYTQFANEYNKFPTLVVNSSEQTFTIYGYSECSTARGCVYSYQGIKSTDLDKLLASSVTCNDGSTNINYVVNVSSNDHKVSQYTGEDEKLYWSEEVTVTCTSSGSLKLDGGSGAGPQGGGTTTAALQTGTKDSYNSSTTTNNPPGGVETYYVILAIVALMSYLIMIIIKKYNLFKNI